MPPQAPNHPRPLGAVQALAIGALLLVVLAITVAFVIESFGKAQPTGGFLGQVQRRREIKEFAGRDSEGREFRLSSLRGKAVLVTFGFTRCPDVCPDTLGKLAKVYQALGPETQQRVQMVFVSVDPRDDPSTLHGYLPFYDPAFLGVTGTREQIDQAARAFGAQYEVRPPAENKPDQEYRVLHSDFIYLVDPAGGYAVRFFHAQLNDPTAVAADVARIVGSAPAASGSGAGR